MDTELILEESCLYEILPFHSLAGLLPVTSQTKINQSAWLRNQTRSWSCNIDILYFETQKLLPISSASTHNLIHRISNKVQVEFGPALCQNFKLIFYLTADCTK